MIPGWDSPGAWRFILMFRIESPHGVLKLMYFPLGTRLPCNVMIRIASSFTFHLGFRLRCHKIRLWYNGLRTNQVSGTSHGEFDDSTTYRSLNCVSRYGGGGVRVRVRSGVGGVLEKLCYQRTQHDFFHGRHSWL